MLVEECDKKIFQNSIKYLYSIFNIPSLNVPALKSIYSTKGRLMQLRNASYLPSTITRSSVKCPRCLLNLKDGPASYKIIAEKKKSRFAKKLLRKSVQDKPMTKYQREYFKRLNKSSGNQLAITCKFCKKESLINLEKPKRNIQSVVSNKSNKKKKSRKKDRFRGLNKEAVLSVTPQNVKKNEPIIDLTSVDDGSKKISRFKLNKEVMKKRNIIPPIKKIIGNKEKNIKKKNMEKLSEVLNSTITKSNLTSNLKNFLKSL